MHEADTAAQPASGEESLSRVGLGDGGWVSNLWVIWASRVLVGRFVAVATAVAVIAVLFLPPVYESSARLMPPDSPSGGGLLSAMLATKSPALGLLAGDFLQMKSSSAVFQAILQSRNVEDHLVARFNLQKVYGKRRLSDARKKLDENTDIEEDRKSSVTTITVRDHDRNRARELTQAYVDELNSLLNSLSTSSARRERMFLEERLKGVQQELQGAEKDFAAFSSKSATIDPKEQGKALATAAVSVEAELIAAQTQLQGLKEIYTNNNVRVRTLEARVAELKRQMGRLGRPPKSVTPGQAEEADVFPSIRELPVLGVTYSDLYRKLKVDEAVFELLTQQYEMAKVQEAKEIPTVKVMDPPELPDKRVGPPRLLIILATVLLAFVAAASWIFLREWWRRTDPDAPFKSFLWEVQSTGARRLRVWRSAVRSRWSDRRAA